MTQRVLILAGIVILAILLAFPMRAAVYEAVVVPLAYVLWLLGLLYRSLPQFAWWIAVSLLILFMFGRSLLPSIRLRARKLPKPAPPKGQVENLATWMQKSDKGVYYKWLVANRLGRLAYQILVQRESGKPRSIFDPLTAPDWDSTQNVQNYLQSGLHGSFADYPNSGGAFSVPLKTPLDHNVAEVVDFLESQQRK